MSKLSKATIPQLADICSSLAPDWPEHTKQLVDELWMRMEIAETDLEIFNLRLKGEWTPNSKLYTQKEVDELTRLAYIDGRGGCE